MHRRLAEPLTLLFIATAARAAVPVSDGTHPSLADVPYGDHARQRLDFYKAASAAPTPLLFCVHGGGWMGGDKAKPDFLEQAIKAGVSVVSINYRLIPDATAAKVWPPVQWPLNDAARALQFVRSHADAWGIDPTRIAGVGGSAGGFSVLYLAMSPDQAKAAGDAIAKQSTRLTCVLAFVPQTTLDPALMRQWVPNMDYGQHAFGLPTYDAFVADRTRLLPWIEKWSPMSQATRDDPPVLLFYGAAPAMGQPQPDPCHSPNQAVPLVEKLKSLGVAAELNSPGAKDIKHPDLFAFLAEHLQLQP